MKIVPFVRLILISTAFLAIERTASATTILIPDGSFTSAGSLSGSTSQTDIELGTTPWYGSNTGILSLLPPSLSINTTNQSAEINGLIGLGVASATSNTSGSIFQTLSTTYTPNTLYTFTADLTYSGLLSANLISDDSAGLKFLSSTGTVLSSTTTPSNILSLSALSSTEEQVVLKYQTGLSVPTGGIELSLFASPTEALSTSLASDLSFTSLSLNAQSVPEPSQLYLALVGLISLCIITKGFSGLAWISCSSSLLKR